MKFPLSWLREFVDIPISATELATTLCNAGFEVESITEHGKDLCNVITGKIETILPHPDADKLTIIHISDGEKIHIIVTGAKNIQVGDIVPVSLPGAILAGGLKISVSKLRGVESFGMLCSQKELDLAEESAGVWVLPADTPVGVNFIDYAKIQDTVLDVAILPNRPDTLSIMGLAREIGGILNSNTSLNPPRPPLGVHPSTGWDKIPSQNQTKSPPREGWCEAPGWVDLLTPHCTQYRITELHNIQVHDSPLWMQHRLAYCGIRSINNVVDITNYVLLETGQPLHAFDKAQFKTDQIIIRSANENEVITTLDGTDRTLQTGDIVICDGNIPVALGGIMGGKDSEITPTTHTVLLEAATFNSSQIRKTAVRLALRSDSAIRFEKGVAPYLMNLAAHRAIQLLTKLAGATEVGTCTTATQTTENIAIPLDTAAINHLLGTQIPDDKIHAILESLGFKPKGQRGFIVSPTWRLDITGTHDLAEEVLRMTGIDHIPSQLPPAIAIQNTQTSAEKYTQRLQDHLVSAGFSEICTNPMISPDDVKKIGHIGPVITLKNPLSQDESIMRPSPIPSLLSALQFNRNRQYTDLKLFEIAKIYTESSESRVCFGGFMGEWNPAQFRKPTPTLPEDQWTHLKGVVENLLRLAGGRDYIFTPNQNPGFHPHQSAVITKDGITLGEFGILYPTLTQAYDLASSVAYFELRLEPILQTPKSTQNFQPYSKFPSSRRDVAILAPKDLAYDKINALIKKTRSPLLVDHRIFDYFESDKIGADNKSIAIAFTYQAMDRSIEDTDVNAAHDALLTALKTELPIQIR